MTKSLLSVINSNPSLAADAFKNLYHGKTFAIGHSNGHIDTFKKTKRGADSHIKKSQQVSYYDEYTHEMVTCGSDMFYEEIREQDILNPSESLVLWFNYLRSIQGQDYLYSQALRLVEYLAVNDQVKEYVVNAIDDMKNYRGLTVIEEVTQEEVTQNEQTEIIEQTETQQETTSESNNNTITYQTGTGTKGNGIEVTFTEKPSEEVRNAMKLNGYRWGGKNRPNIWWAILTDETLNLAKHLAGEQSENGYNSDTITKPTNSNQLTLDQQGTSFNYPEIEIDDIECYIIDQSLQDREHAGHWLMRSKQTDHTKQIQDYFAQLTHEIKEIINTTDNEYIIYQLKKTLQYYKKHYFNNYVARLKNKADNPSWVVTGRAGRNTRKDQKMNNRYDKLMREWIDLDNDYKSRINSLKNKIRKDKEETLKAQLEEELKQPLPDLTFKTVTKAFDLYGRGTTVKTRFYESNGYMTAKLWGAWRVFDVATGKEIYSTKSNGTLKDAKAYIQLQIKKQTQAS